MGRTGLAVRGQSAHDPPLFMGRFIGLTGEDNETCSLRARGPRKAGDRRCRRQNPRSVPDRARYRRRDPIPGGTRKNPQGQYPQAEGGPRPAAARPLRRRHPQLHRHRAELFRPRRRSRLPIPKEPIIFNKAPSCICGPNDNTIIPKESTKLDWEVELAIVIGSRARYLAKETRHERGRRLLHRQRRVRTRIPDRARRTMDQGQGLRDLRPDRAVARHQGRDQGPAESRHVARRQRRAAPARQHAGR